MWLIENPWPVVVLCVLASLVSVFLWSRNKQGKYLLAAAGLLLLCGAAFLVDAAVATEPERVAQQVTQLCFDFQRGKIDRACEHFSDSAPDLKDLVRQAERMVRVSSDLIVSDIQVKPVGTPTHYQTRFRAKATVHLKSGGAEENAGYQPSQWELLWKRENGNWRIVKLARLNPLNQQPMQVFEQAVH